MEMLSHCLALNKARGGFLLPMAGRRELGAAPWLLYVIREGSSCVQPDKDTSYTFTWGRRAQKRADCVGIAGLANH